MKKTDGISSKQKATLMILFILFFLLFNVPFISLPSGMLGALPGLMIYLAASWILLTIAMGIFFSKLK